MEYPDNVSAQDLTKIYLLALGMEMNDCMEPCKTSFVQSSLRKVNQNQLEKLEAAKAA